METAAGEEAAAIEAAFAGEGLATARAGPVADAPAEVEECTDPDHDGGVDGDRSSEEAGAEIGDGENGRDPAEPDGNEETAPVAIGGPTGAVGSHGAQAIMPARRDR